MKLCIKKQQRSRLICSEAACLPTKLGTWRIIAFHDNANRESGAANLALIWGDINAAVNLPVRVHSECLTSEVFGSLKCDCDGQLKLAMSRIRRLGRGLVLYLRQEGRGIGIFNKIRAYHLQDCGLDTVEANRQLGLPDDSRDYRLAAAFLKRFRVKSIVLLTNNPEKRRALEAACILVSGLRPLRTKPTRHNRDYLRTKKQKMSHDL
ncbi:MAG: GTP cyclohydrolase II [Patescibacteria group bacterium]|nr:GTP cyclohydrolase II [Patescibacteria group bacterium]